MKTKTAFRTIRQEHYFPFIIAIHFVFWIIDLSRYTGSYGYTSRHLVGEMLSSWIVTVFAFNFLMTTKAHRVERIFGGLDKMYMIHRRSGVIAVVLLLFHFLVIPVNPQFSIGKPLGFLALFLITVGVICSAAPLFKRIIRYNQWRLGHKVMGLAYLIGIIHSLTVPTLTSELPIVRTYVYGMALIGILSWIYTAFFYRLLNRRLLYKVSAIKSLNNDVTEVFLRANQNQLQYKPGQFAFYSFDGIGTDEVHPFTISSHPNEDHLRVTIKALGDYTSRLRSVLQKGAIARVEGAFGHFNYKNARYKKQLWLAGGIGITPFLSFLKDVGEDYKITLIWSVRGEEALNYRHEINTAIQRNASLEVVTHRSDTGGNFLIGSAFTSLSLRERSVFICGPEAMRESCITQLLEKGVATRDIHCEEFKFR